MSHSLNYYYYYYYWESLFGILDIKDLDYILMHSVV